MNNQGSFTGLEAGNTVNVHVGDKTYTGIVLSVNLGTKSYRPTIAIGWFEGENYNSNVVSFYADNGIEYSYGENDSRARRIAHKNTW